MTLERLHHLYKSIGYIIGGISLIVILILLEDLTVQERIGQVIIMNLGYHLFYYLTSAVPLTQMKWVEENSTTKAIGRHFFLIMSYIMAATGCVMIIALTYIALSKSDYELLFIVPVLSGVIIGSTKLNLNLRINK